jgi:outer membrane protein assembly factor BamD
MRLQPSGPFPTPTSRPARPASPALATVAWRLGACVLLAAMVLLAGCRTHRENENLSDPQVVYARAQKSLAGQDFDAAIRTLEALTARYPFAPESRQARLDLIYAYYKARERESAIDAADTFIRENPTHPRLDYAWYVKGLVDFERLPNAFERLFKVDLDERPPQTARKAFAAFRKVVEDYPKSEYAHDARRRMIHLRNRLADYQLYVARYYAKRGAWVAAAQRSKECIEQYDGAPAVQGALALLIQSYDKLGMKDLAEQSRKVYAANYAGDSSDGSPAKAVPDGQGKWKWWKPFG